MSEVLNTLHKERCCGDGTRAQSKVRKSSSKAFRVTNTNIQRRNRPPEDMQRDSAGAEVPGAESPHQHQLVPPCTPAFLRPGGSSVRPHPLLPQSSKKSSYTLTVRRAAQVIRPTACTSPLQLHHKRVIFFLLLQPWRRREGLMTCLQFLFAAI